MILQQQDDRMRKARFCSTKRWTLGSERMTMRPLHGMLQVRRRLKQKQDGSDRGIRYRIMRNCLPRHSRLEIMTGMRRRPQPDRLLPLESLLQQGACLG